MKNPDRVTGTAYSIKTESQQVVNALRHGDGVMRYVNVYDLEHRFLRLDLAIPFDEIKNLRPTRTRELIQIGKERL